MSAPARPTALFALATEAGILPRFTDTTGTERETGPETAAALLAAMGFAAETEAAAQATLAGLREERATRSLPLWQVIEADRPGAGIACSAEGVAHLVLESGAEITLPAAPHIPLPALPVGLHRLSAGGTTCTLISAPARLPLPAPSWGVTLPVYGLRPPERGGIGSYADLATAVSALAGHGAGFVGTNPLHAGFPAAPDVASPYSPSSRRRLNPMLIAPASERPVPGPLIDYAAEGPARLAALRAEFDRAEFDGDDPASPAFRAFRAADAARLTRFATHQALSARFGPFWPDWPAPYRDPESDAVARFAAEAPREIAFHIWLQWRADTQLQAAAEAARGMRHGLYLDLAVGTHPAGAETWGDPALFARGVSLGAPPDAFSSEGQSWGLAPFIPAAMEHDGFTALAETLRTQFRHARLLRIDHILGFERAFWVPDAGGVPGAYVAMPRDAMLAVVRMEAARAGGLVVGEDLGNVPGGLRAALSASGILGCAVAQFERDAEAWRPAAAYPEAALASFGTHDLPSFHGWRQGRDIAARARIAHWPEDAASRAREARQTEVAGFEQATGARSAAALERFLGATHSRLVALQIEDLLEIEDQPNLPGTTTEYPNWRRRLPLAPEGLAGHPAIDRAATTMAKAGRGGGKD